jgi:hypothetical protein
MQPCSAISRHSQTVGKPASKASAASVGASRKSTGDEVIK